MRHFWVWWLVVVLGWGAFDAQSALEQAQKQLNSKQTQTLQKAYQTYKNIRINAIMQSDTALQKEALEGIIKAGKLLHVDITSYSQELTQLQDSPSTQAPPAQSTSDDESDEVLQERTLKGFFWRDNHIVLEFDTPIDEEDIHHFALDKKFNNRYRYIFDIEAKPQKSFAIPKKTLYDVRLGQYSNQIIRLVLENSKPLTLSYSPKANELIIDLGKKGASPQLTAPTLPEPVKTAKAKKGLIVIDAGHGGKDAGAVGYRKYREKVIVWQIAQKVKSELVKMGFEVYLTRKSDTYLALPKRTSIANDKNADIFVSIHANAVPKSSGVNNHHGIETYFLSPARNERSKKVAALENSEEMSNMNFYGKENFLNIINRQKILASNKLAIDIQKGMLSTLRQEYDDVRDGGVREGPFWVLVGAQMPAVLVEVGFVTHPKEATRLVNSHYQSKLAYGVAAGIKHYFLMNQ